MTHFRPTLFLLAAISFGLGISLPLMRFEKLWFFEEKPSLIEMVSGLWGADNFAIAIVVALFSILFPILKMAVGFQAVTAGRALPKWANILGKWSLVDVMLVAIVLFAAKTSGLASAVALPGIWFFGASSILVAIASYGASYDASYDLGQE